MNKPIALLGLATLGMIYLGLIKIAVITGIATALTYTTTKTTAQKTPQSSSSPKVQPIKVKRKYDGPDSIYPEKMKIDLDPASTGMKSVPLKRGLGGLGKAIGGGTKRIVKGGDDDD